MRQICMYNFKVVKSGQRRRPQGIEQQPGHSIVNKLKKQASAFLLFKDPRLSEAWLGFAEQYLQEINLFLFFEFLTNSLIIQ